MNKNDAPFPQANDFKKVIKILNTEEEKLNDYEVMRVVLGDVTSRQVDYYESACIYLGLMTKEKKFTQKGIIVRSMSGIRQTIALSQIVVSDAVFGTVYFTWKMLGIEPELDDVITIMKQYVSLKTEKMYKRRASTVIRWVKWVISNESE